MRFDVDSFDTSQWDLLVDSDSGGLKVFRCVNWDETPLHGGSVSEYEVDALFDTITADQNRNGYTDYRKVFFFASESDIIGKTYRVVLNAPNAIITRISLSMAIGTASDTMSDKPDDSSFGDSIQTDVSFLNYVPVWIKRTITDTSSDLVYYRNISVSLTVSK